MRSMELLKRQVMDSAALTKPGIMSDWVKPGTKFTGDGRHASTMSIYYRNIQPSCFLTD
jgi:hypothetical protein